MSNHQELLRLLEQIEANNKSKSETGLEEILMQTLLNPSRVSRVRTRVMPAQGQDGVVSETIEGNVLNAQGVMEEFKDNRVFILDDGESTSEISRCQLNGHLVKTKNIVRCPVCSITLCMAPGCGVIVGKRYCRLWHAVIGWLFGY